MLSQKIRNNASISYFFLGWLFLLAKNNPNFGDPFIREHAKIATKGHVVFFVTYFFYSHFLSSFFFYSIPLTQVTIDHCIDIIFFTAVTAFIIRGVYKTQNMETVLGTEKDTGLFSMQGRTFQFSGASEAQRIILLISNVPFISMIVAKRYPNIVTTTGARVSSIFGFIYLISLASGGFNSLSMILLFIGILLLVFLAARFFLNNSYKVPHIFESIPGIEFIYAISRAIPGYIMDIGKMMFGRKDSISFSDHIKNIQEKDIVLRGIFASHFTDETLSFPAYWIFIPFLNLIFLPRIFTHRTTKYVLAISQGIIITILMVIIGFFLGYTSPWELFILFPIFYGLAGLKSDAYVRIPIIYEIYILINTFSFGLLNNSKRMHTAQRENSVVSYKL